jgi:hypothetical protein
MRFSIAVGKFDIIYIYSCSVTDSVMTSTRGAVVDRGKLGFWESFLYHNYGDPWKD